MNKWNITTKDFNNILYACNMADYGNDQDKKLRVEDALMEVIQDRLTVEGKKVN